MVKQLVDLLASSHLFATVHFSLLHICRGAGLIKPGPRGRPGPAALVSLEKEPVSTCAISRAAAGVSERSSVLSQIDSGTAAAEGGCSFVAATTPGGFSHYYLNTNTEITSEAAVITAAADRQYQKSQLLRRDKQELITG